MSKLFNALKGDLFGGITAAVVALPLALAFWVSSGLGPIAASMAQLPPAFRCSFWRYPSTDFSPDRPDDRRYRRHSEPVRRSPHDSLRNRLSRRRPANTFLTAPRSSLRISHAQFRDLRLYVRHRHNHHLSDTALLRPADGRGRPCRRAPCPLNDGGRLAIGSGHPWRAVAWDNDFQACEAAGNPASAHELTRRIGALTAGYKAPVLNFAEAVHIDTSAASSLDIIDNIVAAFRRAGTLITSSNPAEES